MVSGTIREKPISKIYFFISALIKLAAHIRQKLMKNTIVRRKSENLKYYNSPEMKFLPVQDWL